MTICEGERELLNENLEPPARLERLGSALERMARELASSRRELGALTLENATLRAELAILSPGAAATTREQGEPEIELTDSWCPHCGLTVDADTMRYERAILAAHCCPRCDGRLVVRGETPGIRETSVFLG
jgi:hypothetical protein